MTSKNVEESLNKVCVAVDLLNQQQNDETIEEAKNILREARELDPYNIHAMYNLAVLLSHASEKDESVTLFKEVLQLKPHFEDAWVSLALADISNAIPRLNEGLRLCPWSAAMWNALGSIFAGVERNQDAEKAFLAATEVDSKYEPAWMNIISIYAKTGREEEAKTLLQRAHGGRIFRTLRDLEERHEAAQDWVEEFLAERGIHLPRSTFIDADVSSSRGAIVLSVTYIRPSSEDELRSKLSQNPTIARLWFDLGELYLKLGRYDDAEKNVRRSIRLESKNRWKNLVLAQILFASGKLDDAFSEISIAVKDNDTSFCAWKLMKQILESRGKEKEAKAAEENMEKYRPRF
jgi:tetratricopeptide (TPR) repeat protein